MYQSAVFERLTHPRPRSADFLLALANLPALAPAEVRAGLETYQAVLEQQLREVQAKNEHSRQPAGILPPHVEALFDYSLALLAAELAWVNRFVESLD
jgi:hypothetical protein